MQLTVLYERKKNERYAAGGGRNQMLSQSVCDMAPAVSLGSISATSRDSVNRVEAREIPALNLGSNGFPASNVQRRNSEPAIVAR